MQKAIIVFKNNLKYMTLFLSLLLFTSQVYFIITEESNDKIENIEPLISDEKYKKCQVTFTDSLLTAIFKCSLAFLAGGLLSDMKFIKFGVV